MSYDYTGDPELARPIEEALQRVIDPEMAIGILGLGLVYAVDAQPGRAAIRMTMTSAACPVTEVIVDDIRRTLKRALGERTVVDVEVVWDPPWGPERMSESARAALDY